MSTVLEIKDLKTSFHTEEGEVTAVDGVSIAMKRGKVTAIVGESGSGKSVTSYSILRLIRPPGVIGGGQILFHQEGGKPPVDIARLDPKSDQLYDLRGGKISMIFQEPMSALSPVHTVGNQICEAILLHQDLSKEQARAKAIEMLDKVGIPMPEQRIDQYPHELSGGMRQRVVVAMALVCDPEILIADEPTTALDVTIQAQILQLIKNLQAAKGTSVIFITHDFGVVAQIADEVVVMFQGKVVETGPVREVLRNPQHPYTQRLLASLPANLPKRERKHILEAARGASDAAAPGVQPLLRVRDLCKYFPIQSKGFIKKQVGVVKAVDGVSFDLMPGETLGLVGESGSGKTTCARAILRALRPTSGSALFKTSKGQTVDLAQLGERELKPLRQEMQMIFQDPFSSLNPRMTVGQIVGEPLSVHGLAKGSELDDRVVDILERVGLKSVHRQRYPHAFSGGQRQRIGIARALILRPSFIVADEAVSALDLSMQAQVIELLADLQDEFGLTYLFVSHDMSVVRHICDRVAVMYRGKLVELRETEPLFEDPQHPYTRALLSAVPSIDPDQPLNFTPYVPEEEKSDGKAS